MGVTINFGNPGNLDGASAKGSKIALNDFYDVIAEFQKKPNELEAILDKKGDALDDKGKDFIRQFIQYSKRNKVFDGFKKDDAATADVDEFREALKSFVQGQRVAKNNANKISFNDTFSATASNVDPGRAEKVVSFDKIKGYSSPLEFFDEDGNLATQEKVIKDGFLFDEAVFAEDTQKLFDEKFSKLDDMDPDYVKDIEPIIVKLEQGLKLSDKDISTLSTKMGTNKEETEDLANLIKFKYYEARKKAYEASGKSPKLDDDPLTRYFLMEPSGSLQDFKYRLLGDNKSSYSSAFTETKRKLATDFDLADKTLKQLEGHLYTDQGFQQTIKDLASEYLPDDGEHYAAQKEIARLADDIMTGKATEASLEKAFNDNILLIDMPKADRARAILALDGMLSAKPAGAEILQETKVDKSIETREHEMNVRDLKHLSSVKDWLVWLKSSQGMDTLPAEVKSNARELMEKISNFEDLDYSDVDKMAKLYHTLGIDDPEERTNLAHETIKDIYAERQALFKSEGKLDIAGLNSELATKYTKNFELAKIYNNLTDSQRASLTKALEGKNLHEISNIIDQKSEFEALQSPHIQGAIRDLQSQKALFSDLLVGTKSQQQKEWLNIIQSLANFKDNQTFDLKDQNLDTITSAQALKSKSKAYDPDNALAPGKLSGLAEVELTKKRLETLLSSLKGSTQSEKLQSLKDKLAQEGISSQAYSLVPLLLDAAGKSPIDSYLEGDSKSLTELARRIRDDAYFGSGDVAGIDELLQVENGQKIKIPTFDLNGDEITPPDATTGQGGGQNLFNSISMGIYEAFGEDGVFDETKFDELLKKTPELLDIFETIDPSTTKEDLLSVFRGFKVNPQQKYGAAYLYQYVVSNLLVQLEGKYDDAVTNKYSSANINDLLRQRQMIQKYFHSGNLNVDVYNPGERNLTISSQEIENALRELSFISSKIKP